jgi:hypothetical protein
MKYLKENIEKGIKKNINKVLKNDLNFIKETKKKTIKELVFIRKINWFLFKLSILFLLIGFYKKDFLIIKDVGKGIIITIFFQIIDFFKNKSTKIKLLNDNKYLIVLSTGVAVGFYYTVILSQIKKYIN